ncbi:MAG: efflux RND transporter permease subunit [Bdellovibrionaceae bacterium]|nr:efflux RND transporter permease subunit [Pseudobdellovibrionaceae bacterium]
MNLAELSIRRPIFISSVVILSLIAGLMSMSRLGVDLFPDITFPIVTVTTAYPGAGPAEVETLVSKPLEDEISGISGIKRMSSVSREGVSTVIAEFSLETDVKYAEQQVRDRAGSAKSKLPRDIKEPVIRRIDPSDQPVLTLALSADLPAGELFDLADQKIRPRLEQVSRVGLVQIFGGRKREIQVQLDRRKLKAHEISAGAVVARLAGQGEDIPAGKKSEGPKETVFRTVGQFESLDDIKGQIVNFFGNDVPVKISELGTVKDTLVDETSRTYVNGQPAVFVLAYRQSGANTIAVVDALKKRVDKINAEFASAPGSPKVEVVRDTSQWIRANVLDVEESIMIGTILAVVVVFFFLGSFRSTIITGLALPNSLIGAFILMAIAGFSINIMTLLALSLSVGLLIDDAIVVRENIFRHIEMGKDPRTASIVGTAEVRLAVIATTLTVIAVFGPLGFLTGVVGQFFKHFGLTVVFAMAISLFDALTIAPMLSAYFAGAPHDPEKVKHTLYGRTLGRVVRGFDRFQVWLENGYVRVLKYTLRHPIKVLSVSVAISVGLFSTAVFVPKTFLPQQDAGEFAVAIDLPPGTNLDGMTELANRVDDIIRANPEVTISALTVGSRDGDPNYADFYVKLVKANQRKVSTGQFKDRIREQLKEFAYANPTVKDYDAVGGGQRPFNLNIVGSDQKQLEAVGARVLAWMRANPGFKDPDINFRPGKPEFQVRPNKNRAELLGMSTATIGHELRTQIEGLTAAKFRQNGLEYDIRVRLQDDQRNLKAGFDETFVPNINGSLVRLRDVAEPVSTEGPSKINRQDRARYVQLQADVAAGFGMGNLMEQLSAELTSGSLKLDDGLTFAFVGQAENFQELGTSMVFAMGAGILFIFLVLASLYESFVTPFTIMLALPLAICGSMLALAITQESINIFSMIGLVMLLGVATKNSILLVDYANQKIHQGVDRATAIIEAGKTRLRPILMTTMALIAGTLPIAIGLNEASRQRTSMGVAIVGGLISSTLLTLIVIPAAYSYVDRFRIWSAQVLANLFMSKAHRELASAKTSAKTTSIDGTLDLTAKTTAESAASNDSTPTSQEGGLFR